MQILKCLCHIGAMFFKELRQVAHIVDLIADLVYCL